MVFAALKQKGQKVVVRFNNVPENDAEIDAFLETVKAVYDKNEKFVILYDCSNIGWMKWQHIMRQANFMREQEARTKELMVRAAVVVTHNIARGLLKALFKVRKPACPLQVFSSLDKAKAYLSEVS